MLNCVTGGKHHLPSSVYMSSQAARLASFVVIDRRQSSMALPPRDLRHDFIFIKYSCIHINRHEKWLQSRNMIAAKKASQHQRWLLCHRVRRLSIVRLASEIWLRCWFVLLLIKAMKPFCTQIYLCLSSDTSDTKQCIIHIPPPHFPCGFQQLT